MVGFSDPGSPLHTRLRSVVESVPVGMFSVGARTWLIDALVAECARMDACGCRTAALRSLTMFSQVISELWSVHQDAPCGRLDYI